MEVLDAQVHSWLADRPSRPWARSYREENRDRLRHLIHAGQSNGPESVLVEMAEAGVDGAVLSPNGVYGLTSDFELEAMRRFPLKFTVMGYVDHLAPDLEDRLTAQRALGMLGLRVVTMREKERHDRNEFDTMLRVCEDLGLAVALSLSFPLAERLPEIFEQYQGVSFLIDHVGVGFAPPILLPEPGADYFEHLPLALDLARLPNVSMKLTGAPSLSREAYPFPDLWDPIRRIADAFGTGRVLWGSDFTRTAGLHSYWEGTSYLREVPGFTSEELAAMYGQNLRRILGWNPPAPAGDRGEEPGGATQQ